MAGWGGTCWAEANHFTRGATDGFQAGERQQMQRIKSPMPSWLVSTSRFELRMGSEHRRQSVHDMRPLISL
jgi:hypothetical protein